MNGFIAGATVTILALAVALSAEQIFTEDKVPDYTVCAPYISTPLPDIDADDMAGIGEDTCWRDEPIEDVKP
jgi:hypothetical protein